MADIGTLTVRLVATATQFEKTLQNAQKMMTSTTIRMQKQADNMQKLGTAMTLGISAPLAGAGVAALKMAGDMEQTRIAFTNMLGSAEKSQQFLDQLSQFAEKTPFEYTDLTQQARQLMAFGFAAKDVIPMLTAVGDSVAAMGGNADMLDRVTLALGQMQAKQKVSAEEMLQLTEAGIPAWNYLAQAIGKSVPETMKLAEKGLIPANVAINSILNAMEKNFGGMMAQQSQTMLGSWSNLMDVIGRFGRTLGDAINRSLGLTQKIQQLTSIVRMAADALQKMNPALRNTIIYLGVAAIATGPLLYGLGLMSRIMAVTSTGTALLTGVVKRAVFAFTAWRTGAATLGESLLYLAGSKFKLFIFGVGGIITISLLLIMYWDKVVAFAKSAWFAIGAAVLYGASLVVRGVGLILSGIGAIIPAVKGAAQAVLGLADSLKASAGQSLAAAKSAVGTANAGNQVAKAQDQIAKVGQNAANAQDQLGKATEDAAKAAESNIQSFDEVHQIQESMAKSPAAEIPTPNVSVPEMPGASGIGDITAGISDQMGGIMDTLSGAWNRLAQAMAPVNNAIQWIKDNWPTIGPIIENIASIIAVILVPWLIKLGIEALVNGGKVVLSWVMQGAAAIYHAGVQVVQFAILVGKWIWLGIQAVINAGKVVASWIIQGVQAVASAAVQVAQFVLLVGRWILLGVQAGINAAKVVAAWIMQGVQAVASGAIQVAQFALLIGQWILLGLQASVNAAKVVGAWLVQGTQAVVSGAIQLAQFVLLGAKWIWIGVQAIINGAKVVAAWVMQQAPAIATGIVMVAQSALIVGRWILMGTTAMAQAAVMAAAWLISIWPIALVIAAVVGLAILIITHWETIKAKTIEIWTAVSAWLQEHWGTIQQLAIVAWEAVKTYIIDPIKKAWDWLVEAWNNITEWLGSKWGSIGTTANTLWNGIKTFIIDPVKAAWKWLTDTWNSISEFLGKVWNGISTTAGNVWSGIVDTIKGFVNGIIRAINWMIRGLNQIHFTIPDWVPALGGKSFGFNLPEIPLLAQGGIVTKPTLAMIGEAGPEAVVPLSKVQNSDDIAQAVYQAIIDAFRITNASQSANSDREIVLKIDNTTLARLQLPAIIKEGQRQGLNLVVGPQGV